MQLTDKAKKTPELEILFYVFGKSYIDTFLDYCLPSLLTEKNRDYLRSAHVRVWTRTHKEKMRLAAAFDQLGLHYTIDRLLPFERQPYYTHVDYWMHRLQLSDSKKLLFLIPDQLYANDALERCVKGLDTHDCVMFKGLYVLREAIPEARLRNTEQLSSEEIFDIYLHYAHPINLSWMSQTAIANIVHDNIIYLDDKKLFYLPINNHIQGINLEKVKDRRVSEGFCNIYPGEGQSCLYLPNLAVNLDDILNQYNTVYAVHSIEHRRKFVLDHLMNAHRPSHFYPEREYAVVYDFEAGRLDLCRMPHFDEKILLKLIDNRLSKGTYFRRYMDGDRYFSASLNKYIFHKYDAWPKENLMLHPSPDVATDVFEVRRTLIERGGRRRIAAAYLAQMEGLNPGFMDGTRTYLEALNSDASLMDPVAA